MFNGLFGKKDDKKGEKEDQDTKVPGKVKPGVARKKKSSDVVAKKSSVSEQAAKPVKSKVKKKKKVDGNSRTSIHTGADNLPANALELMRKKK